MDLYHTWFDVRPGVKDLELSRDLDRYLTHLADEGLIASYRLTRRKLGLSSADLPEFHVVIETEDLGQLDRAFGLVARRTGDVEGLHAAVNQKISNARFALYRDFPDEGRVDGDELF